MAQKFTLFINLILDDLFITTSARRTMQEHWQLAKRFHSLFSDSEVSRFSRRWHKLDIMTLLPFPALSQFKFCSCQPGQVQLLSLTTAFLYCSCFEISDDEAAAPNGKRRARAACFVCHVRCCGLSGFFFFFLVS